MQKKGSEAKAKTGEPNLVDEEAVSRSLEKAAAVFEQELGVPADSESQKTPTVPLLTPIATVKAGEVATITLGLENDDYEQTMDCRLVSSEFIRPPQCSLPSTCLSLAPDSVKVPPRGAAEICVSVHVPLDAKPGLYSCLLQTVETEPAVSVLQVVVTV